MTRTDDPQPEAPGRADVEVFAEAVRRPEVLGEVFDRYAPELLRYLTRRLGPVDAEDVLGDLFVVIVERRASFDAAAASALPWLYGIASRLVARRHRAETRRLRAVARGDVGIAELFEDAAAERADADRVSNRLAGALAGLSAGDRDVVLLTAWGGLQQHEVSSALGIPVGTVKSRLHRARACLRAELADLDPSADASADLTADPTPDRSPR